MAWGIIYTYAIQYLGKNGTLMNPTSISLGAENLPSIEKINFLLSISLIY
jgi:hypothetical protein